MGAARYNGAMRVLALDTSTDYLSLALWLDGSVLAHDTRAVQQHSELILPAVEALLAEGGVALAALDGVAFGAGPGGFTGLRIGCAVAQGLAFGAELPVVGISSLLALAQGSGAECAIACLDARMGEVYHATYRIASGEWQEVHAPGLYRPEQVPLPPPGAWTGVGSGFAASGAALQTRLGERLARINAEAFPHARDIAALAVARLARGEGVPAWEAAPIYIRDKVALKTAER